MRKDRLATFTLVALAAALALGMTPDRSRFTVSGTLVVRHSDAFSRGVARYSYWVRSDGRLRALTFSGIGPLGYGGRRVAVEGKRTGAGIRVAPGGLHIFPVGPRPTHAQAVGSYRLAVILLNFQNNQSQPWTPSQVGDVVFTKPDSMAAYYQEQSFGQTTVTGDVLGWYTIPAGSTTCDPDGWARAAKSAAQEGRDLAAYDHFMYAFPATVCSWSGLAYLPGTAAWINGVLQLRTIAHEFGHNLGIHHASSLSCFESGSRVSLSASPNCSSSEYGDPFDVMGSGTRHTNDFHKGQLGWMAAQTVTESGTYTLYPQEQGSIGPQLLRIPRGSTGWYLYLEFRRPFSIFDNFAATDPAVNGVSIRLAKDFSPIAQSYLVDATPKTAGYADAALPVGQSLYDPVGGLLITTKSVSSTSATVQVGLAGGPDLALTGTDSSDPIDVGKKLTYKLTAVNGGAPGASDVQISVELPQSAAFVSTTPSRGTCAGSGPIVCSIGSLAIGAKATVTIVVKPTLRGTITASASVASSVSDPNVGNNTVSIATNVR